MSVAIKFGQRLKFVRNLKRMSQDALSLSSGLDRSYISDIENGKFNPSIETVNRLAKALDVRQDQLMIWDMSEPQFPYTED